MALPENWHIRVIQLLSLPGLLLAYFLYLYHQGILIDVCQPTAFFDCGQVSGPQSPYATIGPIPIAFLGIIGYVSIFLLTWLQDWSTLVDDYMPELMLGMTGIAFLFTLWLTALELFVIHAFCQYCVYSAIIVTFMFVLAVLNLRKFRRTSPTAHEESVEESVLETR